MIQDTPTPNAIFAAILNFLVCKYTTIEENDRDPDDTNGQYKQYIIRDKHLDVITSAM